jgi:hypothetical protein
MGQRTHSSGTFIQPYRSPYSHFPIRGYPESTGSTFAAGDLVELDAASTATFGQVVEASSNSTRYLGVAADAASSVQGGALIPVYEARPECEFIGWCKELITSTMIGALRGLHRDTTLGIDVVGSTQSTGAMRVQITEVETQSTDAGTKLGALGDTGGYVAFRFLSQHTAFAQHGPTLYRVDYTEPTIGVSSQTNVALSSHADFTTNGVYLFSPSGLQGVGNTNAVDYMFGGVYCATATELRLKMGTGGSTLSGSTNHGFVVMFKGHTAQV